MKIYCITNTITGKRYIGQTIQSIEARWKQHCTRNGLRLIGVAIREHGAAAFSISQLCEAGSQPELNRLERHWIGRMNTVSPNGYNLNAGGGSGGKMSDETRALMSAKMTQERKAQISEMMQRPEIAARRNEGRKKMHLLGKGKKTGPNKNGIGDPRPAYQAHWDDPEWKAMMIAKRRGSLSKQLANLKLTNALPETKLRRSLAAAKWQAERRDSRGTKNRAGKAEK